MGFGFKIGGRGIVLRPTEIKVFDGESEIKNLTIEGADPQRTLRFTYVADNGKLGDGMVTLSTDSDKLSIVQTEAQKKINEFTLVFNGSDTDESNVSLILSVEETKHFYATQTVIPVTLKRSETVIELAVDELRIVGGKPSGQVNIASYNGDGELFASSDNTEYATSVIKNSAVVITYLKGEQLGKVVNITVGCKAGKFYKAHAGVNLVVTCIKSDPVLTLDYNTATIYGSVGTAVVNVTYTGLDGSMDNLSELEATSDNSNVASPALRNNTVTITYKSSGKTKIRVRSKMSEYYNEAVAECEVTCSKTSVAIPSLKSTSIAVTGNTVTVGVNNLDTNLVTQTGTISTNGIGSWTVYWNLKDPNKYCWSDGTVSQKSQIWNTYGGTITCYFKWSVSGQGTLTFTWTTAWNKWENYPGDSHYGYVNGNYWIGEYYRNGSNYQMFVVPKNRTYGNYYVSGQRAYEYAISNIDGEIGPVNGKTYTH